MACGHDLTPYHSNLVTPAMIDVANVFADWSFDNQDNDYFISIHRLAMAHGHLERIARDPMLGDKIPTNKHQLKREFVPLDKPVRVAYEEFLVVTCAQCKNGIEDCKCDVTLSYWDIIVHLMPDFYDRPADMYEMWDNKQAWMKDEKSCFNCASFLTASCPMMLKYIEDMVAGEKPQPIRLCETYLPDPYMQHLQSSSS